VLLLWRLLMKNKQKLRKNLGAASFCTFILLGNAPAQAGDEQEKRESAAVCRVGHSKENACLDERQPLSSTINALARLFEKTNIKNSKAKGRARPKKYRDAMRRWVQGIVENNRDPLKYKIFLTPSPRPYVIKRRSENVRQNGKAPLPSKAVARLTLSQCIVSPRP